MVPKSFNFARFIYPSEARNQVAFPSGGRQNVSGYRICGGRAMTASGGQFDKPIGLACKMPQGGVQTTSTAGGYDSITKTNSSEHSFQKVLD